MPPSGGNIRTRVCQPRRVVVRGNTIAILIRLLLNVVAEMIKTGRNPACSCPNRGSRSANHTSPRRHCGSVAIPLLIARALPLHPPDHPATCLQKYAVPQVQPPNSPDHHVGLPRFAH